MLVGEIFGELFVRPLWPIKDSAWTENCFELDNLSRQSFPDHQAVGPLEKSRVPWRGSVALHHKFLLTWPRRGLRKAYGIGLVFTIVPVHRRSVWATKNARKAPLGALPGMRIQVGASLEKSVNLWKAELSRSLKKSYSFLEARPRIFLSGALGCYGSPPEAVGPRYSADLFASVGFNAQFGLFESHFCDFTKMGVRLDLGAVTALQSAISSKFKDPSSPEEPGDAYNDNGHPTLAMSFQQQVIGPLRARIDSRVSVDPWNLKQQLFVFCA